MSLTVEALSCMIPGSFESCALLGWMSQSASTFSVIGYMVTWRESPVLLRWYSLCAKGLFSHLLSCYYFLSILHAQYMFFKMFSLVSWNAYNHQSLWKWDHTVSAFIPAGIGS